MENAGTVTAGNSLGFVFSPIKYGMSFHMSDVGNYNGTPCKDKAKEEMKACSEELAQSPKSKHKKRR